MHIVLSAASAHLQRWEWPLVPPCWGWCTNTNYQQHLWCRCLLSWAPCARHASWCLQRWRGRSAFISGWHSWPASLRAALSRSCWSRRGACCVGQAALSQASQLLDRVGHALLGALWQLSQQSPAGEGSQRAASISHIQPALRGDRWVGEAELGGLWGMSPTLGCCVWHFCSHPSSSVCPAFTWKSGAMERPLNLCLFLSVIKNILLQLWGRWRNWTVCCRKELSSLNSCFLRNACSFEPWLDLKLG